MSYTLEPAGYYTTWFFERGETDAVGEMSDRRQH